MVERRNKKENKNTSIMFPYGYFCIFAAGLSLRSYRYILN